MSICIMEDSSIIRMYADKCEVNGPIAARRLRRVAEIMDTPMELSHLQMMDYLNGLRRIWMHERFAVGILQMATGPADTDAKA